MGPQRDGSVGMHGLRCGVPDPRRRLPAPTDRHLIRTSALRRSPTTRRGPITARAISSVRTNPPSHSGPGRTPHSPDRRSTITRVRGRERRRMRRARGGGNICEVCSSQCLLPSWSYMAEPRFPEVCVSIPADADPRDWFGRDLAAYLADLSDRVSDFRSLSPTSLVETIERESLGEGGRHGSASSTPGAWPRRCRPRRRTVAASWPEWSATDRSRRRPDVATRSAGPDLGIEL